MRKPAPRTGSISLFPSCDSVFVTYFPLLWLVRWNNLVGFSCHSKEILFTGSVRLTNIFNFLSLASQPQTPNQPGNSIAEMMDQTYNCSKDPRPNGVAGSLSLRKGAFLHENLAASRRKSPFVNAAYMDGLPTRQFPPHYIDKYARKIFPLLFGLFNIVYWSYYLPRRWCWNWIKKKR